MNVNMRGVQCCTQSLMRICAKKKKKEGEEEEVILDLLLSEAIHSQDTGAIIFSLLPIIFTSIVFNFQRPLNFPTEFCKFSCFVSLLMCIFLQLTQSQECKAERQHLQSDKYISSIQIFLLQNLPCILYFQEGRLTHRSQLVL